MSNGHEDETRLEDVVSWTPSAILQKMVTRQHIPGCILRRMEDGLSSALIRNPLRRSLIEFCFIHGAIHGRRMVDTVILIVQNPSEDVASSHNRVPKNIFLYREIFYWTRSKCHIVERVTLFQIFIVEMWS